MSAGASRRSPGLLTREVASPQRAAVIDKLAGTLGEALQLLHGASVQSPPGIAEIEQGTLLEQCLRLCQQHQATAAEPVRLVHHFACSGGTLISKCIGAMPNTQLLSEIDPLSTVGYEVSEPSFAPTDLNRRLRQGTRGSSDQQVLIELFQSEIRVLHRHADALGQYLVLRDHTHSHYCMPELADRPALRECLPPELPVLAAITVRHPADSFASLSENGWLYIQPPTFDAYCRRYLKMLDANPGVPLVRYEEFVADADTVMRSMCSTLALPFNPDYRHLIGLMQLTGDSGRSSNAIEKRPRRPAAQQLIAQSAAIASYRELTGRLGYDPDGASA